MPHILLVDDDTELSELLSEYLQSQGLTVSQCHDGKQALEKVSQTPYDLMILDIMMPTMDGLSVLNNLPYDRQLPVIMLTAKGDDVDRIIGLELGADDYMSKPCNPRELLARIHTVLKRTQTKEQGQSINDSLPNSLVHLDREKRLCTINGELLNLTGTEFDLLYFLLKNKGQLIDKAKLSENVLQRELQPFDRSIDVHISRLRKKLSTFHEEPIRAIRGKGYQLTI